MKNRIGILMAAGVLACVVAPLRAYQDHRNRKVDSLEQVLRSGQQMTDEQRMYAYKSLMWGYLQTDGRRSAYYASRALSLSYQHHWIVARADALRLLGLNAYGSGHYEQALQYYNHALALTDTMRTDSRYNEADVDDTQSALYGSIANVYNMQDKLHLAIAYYQKALPLFEKHGWMESTSILYYNVGELFKSMGNEEEARLNYEKAVEAARTTGDSLLVAVPHKGLAKYYIGQGNYEKAAQAAAVCYEYYSHHQDEESNDYVLTLVSMARIAQKGHHDLARAEALANEAFRHINDETAAENRADAYNLRCEIAMEKGLWPQALDYAQRALLTDSAETYDDIGTYAYMVQIYAELGDKAHVREYVGRIYNGMERFATQHYQAGLSQMQVLYETEKKQAAIDQLTAQRRWMMWGSLFVGVILVLSTLLFFLLWRSVRLSKRHALVQAKLDGELAERVRIARDLHDRLGGTLTALRLSCHNAEGGMGLLPQVDLAIGEMRNISHHLLPDALSRYGLRVALRDYCATMQNVSFAFAGNEQHVPHEEAIYCIVYELVNNAVKSSGAQHIRVQLLCHEEYTAVSVCDDGCGLQPDGQQEGSGLRNIRQRVAAIGGTLDMNTQPGQGMEVNIELPR